MSDIHPHTFHLGLTITIWYSFIGKCQEKRRGVEWLQIINGKTKLHNWYRYALQKLYQQFIL